VIEEYFRFVTAFLENAPTLLVQDPLLSTIFQAGIAGLSITEIHALSAVLVFYRRLLENKSASVIAIYKQYGANLTKVLFDGLVDVYHEDSISDVAALFKSMAEVLSNESVQWMIQVVNSVPEEYMSADIKNEFMSNWTK
jgi:transportin-3